MKMHQRVKTDLKPATPSPREVVRNGTPVRTKERISDPQSSGSVPNLNGSIHQKHLNRTFSKTLPNKGFVFVEHKEVELGVGSISPPGYQQDTLSASRKKRQMPISSSPRAGHENIKPSVNPDDIDSPKDSTFTSISKDKPKHNAKIKSYLRTKDA
ncbi:hypothetical protein LOTGIDRAFT_172904 [Lottia gigantea]|uniref:Uncharacterized protein n=1 Tax=Lottia gigantea TaxID=225164 RepID=V4B107_LOTGI|nr:hypothetical protein LOTGIDRAFT_172904 [Lottia gigantea]ESP00976.1 hypothetical protein LOTGIDRAFT_172904 [Lottia gigantea]